ncbi:hypothetical protein V502_11180 [Pseudogymnoascus sp. VKM F-4520 (FW-2644)]|nr:hypothetical protein V502_11180 [Pseudogymnoascus sp. VKM F-4520 (FW-2644)]
MPRGKTSPGVPSQSSSDRSSSDPDQTVARRRTTGNRHYKSRQGCFECKRRKVKCQETQPACENCIRLSLSCRYLPYGANPSPGQAVTLHEKQIFNLTDMRLFHHYFVAAYPHYPVRNDNIWISYVTPISHQCDFLMHAILALSASHLEKLSKSGLTKVAQTHRLAAITGLNSHLDKPLKTAADGDAIIATCFALLMQSWYMDDGLESFLVMTRSCELITKHVRGQKVDAILARDDCSRVENMRPRLHGAPSYDLDFLSLASQSVSDVGLLCEEGYQWKLLTSLEQCIASLAKSHMEAYISHLNIESVLVSMDHEELIQLIDTKNVISQLLLAHMVAIQLILRPIVCRERKQYTVTMFSIRMSRWIETICDSIGAGYEGFLTWPLLVSQYHNTKTLEQHILASPATSTGVIGYNAGKNLVVA